MLCCDTDQNLKAQVQVCASQQETAFIIYSDANEIYLVQLEPTKYVVGLFLPAEFQLYLELPGTNCTPGLTYYTENVVEKVVCNQFPSPTPFTAKLVQQETTKCKTWRKGISEKKEISWGAIGFVNN